MATIPSLLDASGPWHRVLALSSPERAAAAGDFVAAAPAALSAARQGRPLVTVWLSRGGGAPLELLTNAGPPAGLPSPRPRAPQELLFPAGARGAPAGDGWQEALGRLVWGPCPGRQAPPLDPEGAPERDSGGERVTLFESALVALMARPFGWVVAAEPSDQIDHEIAELRAQLNVLGRRDEERSRFGAERARLRLAELDAFRDAGLWRVRVLAGAASADELEVIAPVLVGSATLGRHPYRLRAPEGARSLAEALAVTAADSCGDARTPFTVTAGALTALAGLPRREVPGLRVLAPGSFDVTSETRAAPADPDAGLDLGEILDAQDRPVGSFRVPLPTVNRHAFITGATGSGKSQTVRHLLEQATAAHLPWLVIEPVKSEYAAMAGRLATVGDAVTVVNPADPEAAPLSVNPLAPEPGYPVQAHIDMVRALFLAAFDADEPFPQIMSQALQRVYAESGWDVATGKGAPGAATPPSVPTLGRLRRAALAVIDDVGYGRELRADVRGFVDVRLRSLRIGAAGRFFEGGHPADVGGLLRRNLVLAIEDVANDEDKAFLMGTLVIRIAEHLRLRARSGPAGGLRHILVIEEAHRLLRARREDRASAHAVELLAGMLAEIRAYGEGIVVADQIPAKLVPDVIKNTALKVAHRLPAQDDRDLVGAAMNLDPAQSRQVVALEPGVAAVFADGMDRPLRIRVPFGGDRERPLPGPPPPLDGRRSAACGPRCERERACTLVEMRHADLLAGPDSHEDAWLRVWAETLVLAFLANQGWPEPPPWLRGRHEALPPRLRDCLLAAVIERATGRRALAVRPSYEPAALTASVARAARGLLAGAAAGERAGPAWVVPQIRWLHEVERVCPLGGGAPDRFAPAPPLEYALPGLADWPGMRVGQRVRALRRHPLSMELARNRVPAWDVLLGEDDQRSFTDDLASAAVGLGPRARFRQASRVMRVSTWLEVVLSWPGRFLAGEEE